MKTSKKRLSILLSVLLVVMTMSCLAVCFTVSAAGGTDGGIEWDYNNSTKTLTISTAGSGVMNDYSTSNQPWKAYKAEIRFVEISSGVTRIGDFAFYSFTSLRNVTIPTSVTKIGRAAFAECTRLQAINYRGSEAQWNAITKGAYVFDDCPADMTVNYTASSGTDGGIKWSVYSSSTGKVLYITANSGDPNSGVMNDYSASNQPWSAHKAEIRSIDVCDGVTYIGNCAFYGCTNLNDVGIATSVTRVGEDVFAGCTKLRSVVLGDGLTEIGAGMFAGCGNVSSLTIPNSVTRIGDFAFSGFTGLRTVTIPDSVTEIGKYAFSGCTGLTTVTIPDSVTEIGKSAFNGCTNLQDVTIPDSVTSIGERAFNYCTSLDSVTIPNSVTSLGQYAFCSCNNLRDVTIGNGVTHFGSYAFLGCTKLTNVTIEDGATLIGALAFLDCTSLTSVTIPDSVTEIDVSAFSGCTSLTRVNITDLAAWCEVSFESNPLMNGADLYLNGTLVENLTIPTGVTEIGDIAFLGCTSLTSVTIPDSVTRIGYGAFSYCTSLTSVTIPDSATEIDVAAFSHCPRLASVTIPTSVTEIGEYAFANCTLLQAINYLGSEAQWNAITKGEGVFKDCPANITVYYNGLPSGTDGGVNWTYNANTKALTISGTGAMPDYIGNFAGSEAGPMSPWNAYYGEAKTLTVSGVTSIGQYAFSGFGALEDVTISQGVTSIGGGAFSFCNALQTVSIPTSMASIGEAAFFLNERRQITVNYPGSAAQWNAIQCEEYAFASVAVGEFVSYKVAVVLPGFVNLPFGTDGLKDKDWYFDFSAYVPYMVEKTGLVESYPGEAEEFFEEAMASATLQFNPATETIMYTYNDDGKAKVFEMTQEDEYNTYRPFIKQYTAPVPTYTVTANAEAGGSATGGGTFNKGATATVKATPNSGYHFTGWYKGNSKVSGDASYSFTVTENVTLTAKFEKDASPSGGDNGGNNQNTNRCHWCGKTHDANFFQKIIGFFHNILAKIFGNKY